MKRLSRREFIKATVAGLGTLASTSFLVACGDGTAPSSPPIPVGASQTIEEAPTPTRNQPTSTPSFGRYFPDATSDLVLTRHNLVWQGEELSADILRQMLDTSIQKLTRMDDPIRAWKALFKPEDLVAIKVNSTENGNTHPALVMAVVDCLVAAGITENHITLYDRQTYELQLAGYSINKDGPGIRCHGTDYQFKAGFEVNHSAVGISEILYNSTALINMPILKAFTYGGLSFAMKNHYGTIDTPSRFHDQNFTKGITGINSLSPIKDRTRLIVGDLLTPETHQDFASYVVVGGKNSILMTFDPVAADSIGLKISCDILNAAGNSTEAVTTLADPWLKEGENIGLGANQPANMNLMELNLN